MLIGADIDQLYATIAVFRRSSAELNEAFQRAIQAMQAMQQSPWIGRNREQAEAVWERIQVQFPPVISTLEELIARTERFANNLAEAGRSFNEPALINWGVGQRPTDAEKNNGLRDINIATPAQCQADTELTKIKSALNILKTTGHGLDIISSIYEVTKVAGGLRIVKGTTYPKQLEVRGSKEILEMAFLNPNLRHLKGETKNILQKMIFNPSKNAIPKKVPSTIISDFFVTLADNVLDNWEEYKCEAQNWQKTVAGIAIDTTVDTVLLGLGSAGGTFAGGVIGGALLGVVSGGTLAPLGVTIGANVGGILGSYASGIVSDWIKDQKLYKDMKEVLVDKGADLIDETVQTGQKMVEDGQKVAQETITTVIQTGQQVQRVFNNLISSNLKWWGT